MHLQEVDALPRVETPMGRSNMVERSAPAPRLKGSFLAPLRIHIRGQFLPLATGSFRAYHSAMSAL